MKIKTRIGTAAWSLSKENQELFPAGATLLERYAQKLNAVEINTTFYRHHQEKTYERWAATVPPDFSFSVKLHQHLTHEMQLKVTKTHLEEVLGPISPLKKKWGMLLVQLPKSLEYHPKNCELFLRRMREITAVPIALEARNSSFESPELATVLREYRASLVISDPKWIHPPAALFGAGAFYYYRLHGSPKLYKSKYSVEFLKSIAAAIQESKKPTWCIFDNTTFGHATGNALNLRQVLEDSLPLSNKKKPRS